MKKLLLVALAAFGVSCTARQEPATIGFEYEEWLDRVYLQPTTGLRESDNPLYEWRSDKDLRIDPARDGRYYFLFPWDDRGTSAEVTLTVRSDKLSGSFTRSVPVARNNEARSMGLGRNVTEWRSNDVDYPWYVNQGDTGEYSSLNCAPAVAEMAGRWVRQDFPVTAEQIRHESGLTTGINTNTLIGWLSKYGIPNRSVRLNTPDVLFKAIDDGNIAILGLDMFYVARSSGPAEWRKDRFFPVENPGDFNHYIIVKGYVEVDGEYLFECYDPNHSGYPHPDGRERGPERYYRPSNLIGASEAYWGYEGDLAHAIIVSPE